MSGRIRTVVVAAQAAVAAYTKNRSPMPSEQAELAGHAIRLAKLDSLYRAGQLDPGFEDADPADVQDLLALLAIVPFDHLLHDKILHLNPTFGGSSLLVGGADADLITGDLLVDLKTTKAGEMQAVDLDQLLGYFLLARHERLVDPAFPEVRRLGLYFCRHGHLWSVDATTWTGNPLFAEVEEWFFEKAQEVFGERPPAPQGQPRAHRSGRPADGDS
jgi:hypothetical protein